VTQTKRPPKNPVRFTTTVVPYILYLLHTSQPEERAAIYPLLEGYLVRRVICRETSKNYNRLFGAWIKSGVKTVAAFKAALIDESNTVNRYPDDAAVRTRGFPAHIAAYPACLK